MKVWKFENVKIDMQNKSLINELSLLPFIAQDSPPNFYDNNSG